MEQFFNAIFQIPAANQMFVIAIVCIVGFGWVFVKVLNKQTDILGDIREVLTKQNDSNAQVFNQTFLIAESLKQLAQEMALHRQASETITRRTEIHEERKAI